ncbi:PilZ domain-containing protein [Sphingomonas mucosissima]|uniref:PilZ domain protein n=1 Tax=Sphingomonas mucosissima TaxID=370959 RepID=A0A245ZTJ0_9SPHN|nr:PilZ domain-containing protein [Sphingomonas mucosissima]OWK33053.1 PilZ domain protein [Sphingomonas mucosissima]
MTEELPSNEPPAGDTEPKPRAPRHSVFLSAIVEHFGAQKTSRHRVRDLSSGGVRIDQAGGFRKGATVLVSVGALDAVGATVVWVKDDLAGLEFAEPVNPEAARAKAAVAPPVFRGQNRDAPGPTPSAGWMPNLQSPYRR